MCRLIVCVNEQQNNHGQWLIKNLPLPSPLWKSGIFLFLTVLSQVYMSRSIWSCYKQVLLHASFLKLEIPAMLYQTDMLLFSIFLNTAIQKHIKLSDSVTQSFNNANIRPHNLPSLLVSLLFTISTYFDLYINMKITVKNILKDNMLTKDIRWKYDIIKITDYFRCFGRKHVNTGRLQAKITGIIEVFIKV